MAASAQDLEIIGRLREEIRRLERRPPAALHLVPTGRPEVDAQLPGGGFPRGALCELSGGQASGKTALALRALAGAMGEAGLAAFVDGRGELYPPAAAALGVDLDRLLVVRPAPPAAGGAAPDPAHALWAAEAVLASGAFEAVVVDIPTEALARDRHRARLEAMLRRVRAAAEKGGALALWLGTPEGARVPAAVRLEVSPGAAGPRVRRTFAREPGAGVGHAA